MHDEKSWDTNIFNLPKTYVFGEAKIRVGTIVENCFYLKCEHKDLENIVGFCTKFVVSQLNYNNLHLSY